MLELVFLDLALIVILACLPRPEARRPSSGRREAKELLRSRRPSPSPSPVGPLPSSVDLHREESIRIL